MSLTSLFQSRVDVPRYIAPQKPNDVFVAGHIFTRSREITGDEFSPDKNILTKSYKLNELKNVTPQDILACQGAAGIYRVDGYDVCLAETNEYPYPADFLAEAIKYGFLIKVIPANLMRLRETKRVGFIHHRGYINNYGQYARAVGESVLASIPNTLYLQMDIGTDDISVSDYTGKSKYGTNEILRKLPSGASYFCGERPPVLRDYSTGLFALGEVTSIHCFKNKFRQENFMPQFLADLTTKSGINITIHSI